MNFRITLSPGTPSRADVFLADSDALRGVFFYKICFNMKTTVIIQLFDD
jgi:hypothetical protein